jgi:two-component system, NarL family, sensor kinase
MQDSNQQIIVIIIAVIAVLLFLGILFLIMIWAYNNRKQQAEVEKIQLKHAFDRQLLQATLEIQEDTFNNISQELHDHVGQLLSLAKVQLNIMEQRAGHSEGGLREVKDSISQAMTILRDIAKGLSTERVQLFSFAGNIDQEIERINRSGATHVILTLEGTERPLDEQVKLILFRIIQEALQNVIKHAAAAKVVINCNYMDGQLYISICDDGAGFHVSETLARKSGLGLQHITSRAAILGGQANITSHPGKGTIITITIPHV